jgi:site-specific DNA-methyltransferase (adenine-specific)
MGAREMNDIKTESLWLMRGDCLERMKEIPDGSVDLIVCDLPYGTVKNIGDSESVSHGMKGKTGWDSVINCKSVMGETNRVLRKNGKMCLFAQQPFTTELINSAIPNLPFNYALVWEKDHFANSLIAKKAPVNYTEDILVFSKNYDHQGLHPLRDYFKMVMDFIGLNAKQINTKLGHRRAEHTFYVDSTQYGLCTEKTYNELISTFSIDSMVWFKPFPELEEINSEFNSVFNLWEGKKFKSNILKYKKDYTGFHPTQKPILLLEDLIKTYSNEGDLILDMTIGSGSTGVAAKNLNRKFIGIELDQGYFDIAKSRILNDNPNTN